MLIIADECKVPYQDGWTNREMMRSMKWVDYLTGAGINGDRQTDECIDERKA